MEKEGIIDPQGSAVLIDCTAGTRNKAVLEGHAVDGHLVAAVQFQDPDTILAVGGEGTVFVESQFRI